ncbi:hypothetical protein HanIR_Chr12g0562741 [Helianthus annuus]|nr:hypothetical protein HanIR_Chr12g0562741 [Helianthus annuus]
MISCWARVEFWFCRKSLFLPFLLHIHLHYTSEYMRPMLRDPNHCDVRVKDPNCG